MIHSSFSETRNNHVLSELVVFWCKKMYYYYGDNMRYYIIFGITLVIALIILLYPQKYLNRFNNKVTIDYSTIVDTNNELWVYEIDNDNLKLDNQNDKKWTFKINKEGITKLTFYYDKNDESQKYKIYYKFEIKKNKIYWIEGNAIGLLDYPNPY